MVIVFTHIALSGDWDFVIKYFVMVLVLVFCNKNRLISALNTRRGNNGARWSDRYAFCVFVVGLICVPCSMFRVCHSCRILSQRYASESFDYIVFLLSYKDPAVQYASTKQIQVGRREGENSLAVLGETEREPSWKRTSQSAVSGLQIAVSRMYSSRSIADNVAAQD